MSCLILTAILQSPCVFVCVTDEKAEAQRMLGVPLSGGAGNPGLSDLRSCALHHFGVPSVSANEPGRLLTEHSNRDLRGQDRDNVARPRAGRGSLVRRSCSCFSWQSCASCPCQTLTPQILPLPPSHAQSSLLSTVGGYQAKPSFVPSI